MSNDQDKELEALETELRSFRPAPLSECLKERILRSANAAPKVIRFSRLKLFTAAAAAVLLIAIGLILLPRTESVSIEVVKAPAELTNTPVIIPQKITIYRSAPQRILKPVSYNTTLVAQREIGPPTNSPTGPACTVHRRYVDQYEWCDEEHDTVYTTRKPRDSFVVVPVSSY